MADDVGFVSSGDAELWWEAAGTGPDVAFVHAGIANLEMWDPQVASLRDRYRCVRPDVRGFGKSTFGAEDPFRLWEDLRIVLDAAGVERAHLVGCSIGAGTVLDFALTYPERTASLVLVGVTPSGFDEEDDADFTALMERADELYDAQAWDELARLEARVWVDGPRRPEGCAPDVSAKVVEWLLPTYGVTGWRRSQQLDPPAMGRLDEVVAPTLVIVGDEDAEVVLAGSRATAAGIPGARLEVMTGTAHLPNLERADAFTDLLAGFLDEAG